MAGLFNVRRVQCRQLSGSGSSSAGIRSRERTSLTENDRATRTCSPVRPVAHPDALYVGDGVARPLRK